VLYSLKDNENSELLCDNFMNIMIEFSMSFCFYTTSICCFADGI